MIIYANALVPDNHLSSDNFFSGPLIYFYTDITEKAWLLFFLLNRATGKMAVYSKYKPVFYMSTLQYAQMNRAGNESG